MAEPSSGSVAAPDADAADGTRALLLTVHAIFDKCATAAPHVRPHAVRVGYAVGPSRPHRLCATDWRGLRARLEAVGISCVVASHGGMLCVACCTGVATLRSAATQAAWRAARGPRTRMQLRVQGTCRTERSCVLRAINTLAQRTNVQRCTWRCGQSVTRAERRGHRPSNASPSASAHQRAACRCPLPSSSVVTAAGCGERGGVARRGAERVLDADQGCDHQGHAARVADRRRAGVRAARRRVIDAGVVRSLVRRLWSRTPLQPRSNAKRFAPLRATRDVTRRRRCAAPWMRRQAAVALTAVRNAAQPAAHALLW